MRASPPSATIAKGIPLERWIFDYSTDTAKLVSGTKRAIIPSRPEAGYLLRLDQDGKEINYTSTYDSQRECLGYMASLLEDRAAEHREIAAREQSDAEDCEARAKQIRERIAAL